MTAHDILAFGIGMFATASLWAWRQFFLERQKNKLAARTIAQLLAERAAASKAIHDLGATVLRQQAEIEQLSDGGYPVLPDDFDEPEITGRN